MGFTLRQGMADYHIVKHGEQVECKRHGAQHSTRTFMSEEEASAFLRVFFEDPAAANQLRSMTLDVLPMLAYVRLTNQEALQELARRLVAGSILVVACVPPRPTEAPEQAEALPPPRSKAAPPVTARHWIEFKVIEEKTKRLVPEVTLELNLPGRGKESHTTEAKALHIALATSGVADLLKMTHADVWEAVEVQSG